MTDWPSILAAAGRQLATARKAEQHIRDHVREQAIAAAADNVPETRIAELLGVDRMTVRKWCGK